VLVFVAVEVRVGETVERAALFGTRTLAKGETWEVDTSGALAWWRREVTPGANDGRFTAWKSVDTISSDEKIEL